MSLFPVLGGTVHARPGCYVRGRPIPGVEGSPSWQLTSSGNHSFMQCQVYHKVSGWIQSLPAASHSGLSVWAPASGDGSATSCCFGLLFP